MENCVSKVNAMFMEQYILWMMQDKLQKDGDLSKEMIESYIDKIEVYDEKHIEILWKESAGQY